MRKSVLATEVETGIVVTLKCGISTFFSKYGNSTINGGIVPACVCCPRNWREGREYNFKKNFNSVS